MAITELVTIALRLASLSIKAAEAAQINNEVEARSYLNRAGEHVQHAERGWAEAARQGDAEEPLEDSTGLESLDEDEEL